MSLLRAILDMVYPPDRSCRVCGSGRTDDEEVEVCGECLSAMPFISFPICMLCGRPAVPWEKATDGLCPGCANETGWRRKFSMNRSLMLYEGLARDLMLGLKFMGRYQLAEPLSQLMAAYVMEVSPFPRFNQIVPVPLHPDKLVVRGYNQTELLARGISERLGVCMSTCLARTQASQTQSLVGARERRANIKGCFAVTKPGDVVGKIVLLVDDIFTTGATLDECSAKLIEAGARVVLGFTVALVLPERDNPSP